MIGRTFGVAAPALIRDLTSLEQVSAAVGAKPTVATYYEHWAWKRPFPVSEVDGVVAWGATPQVTWEPFDSTKGIDQPLYRLSEIAKNDGPHVAYITAWAQAVAAWGKPIRIRFAHEMNNRGYPWCAGLNENTPDDYIRAWLRVRKIFKDAGATNVTWVWCPQNAFPGTVPLSALFPGDAAIDEVAIDGYNWTLSGNPWTSFTNVFKRSIAEITPLTGKPISIGETGCPEIGGNKAVWIRDMWTQLADWPQVRGLLWFNFNKEADWRIDSSPAALEAFKAGLPGFLAQ